MIPGAEIRTFAHQQWPLSAASAKYYEVLIKRAPEIPTQPVLDVLVCI